MSIFNAHRVLTGAPNGNDYLSHLTLEEKRVDLLRTARDEIRTEISGAFSGWKDYIREEALFIRMNGIVFNPTIRKPKFRMQGSMAYHTLNDPAHTPPQEIDADDGLFLPVSFFEVNGSLQPRVLSSGLFQLIESALEPLCRKRGWRLDTTKPSCVRVCLDNTAHVDIALYAMPDSKFEYLVESAMSNKSEFSNEEIMDSIEFAESLYEIFPHDQIMLAHRQEGWKPSDPRKLEDWFKNAVTLYGYQVRRICRYVKGWRDEQWETSKLTSIALMKCVVDAYQQVGNKLNSSRDDEALMYVAELLPDMLRTRVQNPVILSQFLDEGWTEEERNNFVSKAEVLANNVRYALEKSSGVDEVLRKLRNSFGERIPNESSLVLDECGKSHGVLTSGLLNSESESVKVRQAVKKSGGGRYA